MIARLNPLNDPKTSLFNSFTKRVAGKFRTMHIRKPMSSEGVVLSRVSFKGFYCIFFLQQQKYLKVYRNKNELKPNE